MGSPRSWRWACAAFALLSLPCAAAAVKKPQAVATDLAVRAQKHRVACPLPAEGACVVRKPVGSRYRVLTPGANLEDMGDYWLADFTKTKDAKVNRLLLRVLADSGELHEIEVRFPPDPAAKPKPQPKEADKPVEVPKPAPAEPAGVTS